MIESKNLSNCNSVVHFHIHYNFVSPVSASQMVTPAMDIYSFGMCALETAALEIQGNGDSGSHVTEEHIVRTVESLEETRQKDFIYRYIPNRLAVSRFLCMRGE